MELTWHQPDARPTFEDAEFYDHGPVVTVAAGDRKITIDREGDSCLEGPGDTEVWRSATQFRTRFPDGQLPEDGEEHAWVNNGWFDLYSSDRADGENGHLDRLSYTLTEANGEAEDLLDGQ